MFCSRVWHCAGYGGVVERDVVLKGADWFIKDFQVREGGIAAHSMSIPT